MVQNHSPDCRAGNQADDLVNNRTNHHNQQRNAYDRPEVFFKKFPSAHDAVAYIQLVIPRQDRFNRRRVGDAARHCCRLGGRRSQHIIELGKSR